MTQFGTLNQDGTVTNTMTIELNNVPSSDPIAFSYGLFKGQQWSKDKVYKSFKDVHGSNYREIANEYLRGFKLGSTGILLPEGYKIRKGTECI